MVGSRRYPYRGRSRRQQKSQSAPNSPRPTSPSEISSYSDHEVMLSSAGRMGSVKSLYELAQFACNMRKIVPKDVSQIQTTSQHNAAGVSSTLQEREDGIKEDNSNVPCTQAKKPRLTSDSENGTDILNSSDEIDLTSRLHAFEEANTMKGKHFYDSGISESFYSSQGSIAEGFMYKVVPDTSESHTPTSSQAEAFDSGLDSSCGLSKLYSSELYNRRTFALGSEHVATITSSQSSEDLKPATSGQLYTSQSFSHSDFDMKAESSFVLSKSKSVNLPQDLGKTTWKDPSHITAPVTSDSICSSSNLCTICLEQPKDASLVHGNSGHQVCCYQCGKKLKRNGKLCPVCRRPIQKVIRNFTA